MISCKIRFPASLNNDQVSDIIIHDFDADVTFFDNHTCIINTESSASMIASLCIRNGFQVMDAVEKLTEESIKPSKTLKKSGSRKKIT